MHISTRGTCSSSEASDTDKSKPLRRRALKHSWGNIGRTAASALGCAIALLAANHAEAQTSWTNVTGDWFTAGNWTAGIPTSTTATTIDQGTAQIGATGAVSGALSLGVSGTAGTLTINTGGVLNASSVTIAANAGSTGTLQLNAGGELQTGGLTAGSGTAVVNFAGGTLQVVGSTFTSNVNATLSGTTTTIDTNGQNATFSGVLSGAGATAALTKAGVGTLTLSGTNTYQGPTNINAGTLSISADNNLGQAPAIATAGQLNINGGTLQATSTFTLNSNRGLAIGGSGATIDVTGANTLTYGGVIAGATPLTKTDTGTLVLSGANTYSGATNINGGTLSISADGNLGQAPAIATAGQLNISDGTLQATSTFTLNSNRGIAIGGSSGATIDVTGANTLTYGGIIAGTLPLTKTDTGTLVLSGANTYQGATAINGGTLSISADNNLGTAPGSASAGRIGINGATLQATGTFTLNSNRGMAFGVGGATIDVTGTNTLTYGGIAVGSALGSLTKTDTGTLVLSGANTYLGATNINGGTLSISADNNLGAAPGSATAGQLGINGGTLQTTATFTLNSNRGMAIGASGATIDVTGTNTLTYGGIIAGSGSLTKTDTGTLVLSGASTYTGATNINGGTLSISADNNLGAAPGAATAGQLGINGSTLQATGTFTLNSNRGMAIGASSATIDVTGTNTLTYGGIIAGAGPLTKADTGTLALSGVNTFIGAVNISSGTLSISSDSNLGNTSNTVTINAATLQATSTFTLDPGRSIVIGASGATFDVTGSNTLTFAGTLGGGTSLTKTDTGTLVLTGGNTFHGNFIVNGGTLSVSNDAALGIAPNTITLNGGTLEATTTFALLPTRGITLGSSGGGVGVSNGSTLTYSGVIGGTGALTKSDTGTLVLNGVNTYSGPTNINGGILSISSDANLGTTPGSATANRINFNGGTLQATASFTLNGNRGIALVGAGTIDITNGSALTYGGIIADAGSLTLTESDSLTPVSTLTLTGTNTYTGATNINGGILIISKDANLGAAPGSATANQLTFNGGELEVTQSFALSANRGITLNTGGGTLDVTGANTLTYGGVIAGTGILTKDDTGTLILTGVNTYTGATIVNGGTLSISSDANLGTAPGSATTDQFQIDNATLLATGTFTLSSNRGMAIGPDGAIFDVTGSNTVTYGGAIAGSGSLTKNDTGTLVLAGTSSYTGVTIVNAGTLSISSDASLGSAPGSLVANQLQINNSTLQGNGSFTMSSTRGIALGGSNDTFDVTAGNTVTYGGVIGGGATLTKTDSGTLALTGTNTYTGPTVINGGILSISSDGGLGAVPGSVQSASITLNGGSLGATGTFELNSNRGITLGASGGGIDVSGTNTLTYNGVITGAGAFTKSDSGTLILGGVNTYTGVTNVTGGLLSISADNNLGLAPGSVSAAQLGLNGGTLEATSTFALNSNRGITLGASGGSIGVSVGNTLTYGGVIAGSGGLTKSDSGTLLLTGTNTYLGTTSVAAGILQVNGSLGNAAVTVQNGGTLAGTGTIGGAVTVANGGTLTPGAAGAGTLTVGSLTLSSGSILNYQLSTPGVIGSAGGNGLVVVNGDLTLAGTLNITNGGNFSSGAYQLFQYHGTLTNDGLTIGAVPAGYSTTSPSNFLVVTGVAGEVDLIVEPNAGSVPTQFWDGTGPANNGAINGGSGTWGNFSSNFTTSDGSSNSAWQDGVVVFGNTGGTVTVSGAINFGGLIFMSNGYVINSDGVAGTTFNPIGLPTNTGSIASISTSTGVTATINAVMGGGATISKDGAGTLILNGANTYTGGTLLDQGTLGIGNNSALGTSGVTVAAGGGNIFAAGAAHTMSNGITLNGNLAVVDDPNGAQTLTLSGQITGSAGIVMDGTGTLILTNSNSYQGGTALNSGTIGIGNANAFGTGPVTVGSGGGNIFAQGSGQSVETAFVLNGNLGIVDDPNGVNTLTLSGPITGAGALVMNGTGTLVVSGTSNTYTGGTEVANGTLQLGANGALPTGGLVQINQTSGAGNATLDLNGKNQTIGNLNFIAAHGGQSVVNLNGGTLKLNGNVFVTDNTAAAGHGSSSIIEDTSGGHSGVIDLGGQIRSFNVAGQNTGQADLVVNAPIQNGGVAINAAPSTFNATEGGVVFNNVNTYQGGTTVAQGRLTAGVDGAIPTGTTLVLGTANSPLAGDVDLHGTNQTISSLNLAAGNTGGTNNRITSTTGASLLTVNSNTLASSYGGTITGAVSLLKLGSQTLTLTAANTFTGNVGVGGGTLAINNGNNLGSATSTVYLYNNGTLQTIANVTSSHPITLAPLPTITPPPGATTVGKIDTNGFTFTQSGIVSGAGTLTKTGAGVLALTAANTYTGGTTVTGGLINFSSATNFGAGGAGSVTLNGGGVQWATGTTLDISKMLAPIGDNGATFDTNGNNVTLASPLSGTGGITKTGNGNLILTAANTFTGPSFINQGMVDLEGAGSLAKTTVNPGAALIGMGTVKGDLVNNGFVAPGYVSAGNPTLLATLTSGGSTLKGLASLNSSMTVTGNYIQNAGGTLVVGFGGTGPGQHTTLNVLGAAALVGGELRLVPLPGTVIGSVQTATIINATQGVFGSFDSTTNTALVNSKIIYQDNTVLVVSTQNSLTSVIRAIPKILPGELSSANGLDSALSDPRSAKLLAYLDSLNTNDLLKAIQLFNPEPLTFTGNVAASVSNVHAQNLQLRMESLRAGVGGFSAMGFRTSDNTDSSPWSDYNSSLAGPTGPDGKSGESVVSAPSAPNNRWGSFITGSGEFNHVGDTESARGFTLDSGGITLGADYRFTDHFVAGFFAGYTGTNIDISNGGRITADAGKVGIYSTYFDGGFYVDTALQGGYTSYDTHREALQGVAHSSPHGGDVNVLFAPGYNFTRGAFTFGPIASFQYSYQGTNGFTETGSLAPVTVNSQHTESIVSAIGMKASYDWKWGGVTIRPEVRVSWEHEFGDVDSTIDARLANGAGSVFSVSSPEIGRDSLHVGAGFSVVLSERLSTYLYYDGEFFRTDFSSSAITGGLRFEF